MFVVAKCSHSVCQLPDNNNRFILQGVYILIGVCVLLSKPENFTYFQTMLFISPILIDIVCSGPNNLLARIVRWGIGIIDTIIILICFLGLGGIIVQDTTSYFLVETMLLFGGIKFKKAHIAVLLVINLIIPVIYYTYSPCKTTAKIKDTMNTRKEVSS